MSGKRLLVIVGTKVDYFPDSISTRIDNACTHMISLVKDVRARVNSDQTVKQGDKTDL